MSVLHPLMLLTGSSSSGYRGPDRRRIVPRLADPLAARVAGWALLAVIAVPLAAIGVTRALPGPPVIAASVATAGTASVVFLAAGAVVLMRWRLVGDAASLVIGAGTILVGLLVVPAIYAGDPMPGYLAALQSTALLVALVLFLGALGLPEVCSRLRPTMVVSWTIAGALVLALALTPVVVEAQRSHDVIGSLRAFEALACAMVAIPLLVRGVRAGHLVITATAVALISISAGCAAISAGRLDATAVPAAPPSFFLLIGAVQLLLLAAIDLRSVLGAIVLQDVRGRRRWAAAETELARVRSAHSGTSHDIASMLTAIDGALLVLSGQRAQLRVEDGERLITAVRGQIQHLRSVLAVDGGVACPYDLSELLLGIVALHITAAAARSVVVEPGLMVRGHPDRVTLVVNNLLANAAVHAPLAAVTVTARRDVSAGASMVEITIADGGPGLPVADMEKAFEPGWRGAAASGLPGSGLGLSQCRELVESEGGEISLVPTQQTGGDAFSGLSARVRLPVVSPAFANTSSILQMRLGPAGEIPNGAVPGPARRPRD